jgi:hypothetical protein
LNVDHTLRTGFLHAGHFVRGAAEVGRRSVNLPPHTLHSPSHSSYSYNGIFLRYFQNQSPVSHRQEVTGGTPIGGTSSPRTRAAFIQFRLPRVPNFVPTFKSQISNLKFNSLTPCESVGTTSPRNAGRSCVVPSARERGQRLYSSVSRESPSSSWLSTINYPLSTSPTLPQKTH